MALIEKLTAIANGFRSSRGITNQLSLDEMAVLAAEPSIETQEKTIDLTANGTYELYPDAGYALSKVTANVNVPSLNKLPQLFNKTITELTASDLEGTREIPESAFARCKALTNVTIPGTVTKIGNRAFDYCDNLTSVTILDGVEKIGNSAFVQCYSLTSIIIPNSVTFLGSNVFEVCSGLTSVIIGNNVPALNDGVLYGCTSLTSVTIPNSVTSIGWGALQIGSTTNKATITFLGTTPPSLNADGFNANYLNKIIVPAGYGDTYKNATNWANFADYIEEAAI